MRITRREFVGQTGLLIAATAAGLLPGCRKPETSEEEKSDSELKDFSMQAAWVNDAEFMGYFVALHQGFYEDQGLRLDYQPGGPQVIPEGTLLSNRADLALTTPDTTVNLILKEGAPLKIIGTQYQKSPLGVVSLAESNISEPKHLIGKTLAVPPVNVLSVEAMLRINGIDPKSVTITSYQYDPTPLINRQVDATIDFVTNVPFTIEQKGPKTRSFLLYDFGFTIYNDTVVVTEETLRTRRADLVTWLRASRKGWEENLKDPKIWPPRFRDSYFKGNGRTIENEIYFNEHQKPLIESPSGVFSMTEEGIQANIKALNAIGLAANRDMFVTDLLKEV